MLQLAIVIVCVDLDTVFPSLKLRRALYGLLDPHGVVELPDRVSNHQCSPRHRKALGSQGSASPVEQALSPVRLEQTQNTGLVVAHVC